MDAESLLGNEADNISVRRAFGTAYEKDGMLIIPVAMVAGGGAAGTARTRRGNPAARPDSPPGHEEAAPALDVTPQDSGRMDAGGGFGGLVLPSGAYVVKGDQVRWVPAVDVTIVVLASLSLARVLARTWTHRPGHRGRHQHRQESCRARRPADSLRGGRRRVSTGCGQHRSGTGTGDGLRRVHSRLLGRRVSVR